MKKAIITGPTGAVGISLINELIANDYFVTAICRPNSKRIHNILAHKNIEILECDQANLLDLSDVLLHDYNYFYHFSWDGTYGLARQDVDIQMQNINCTLDAVKLAKKLNCTAFIGAGSQSEFGHVDGVLNPNMPCKPDNGYGIAKLAAGQLSRILSSQLGIRHEWCRIVSLYGPFDGDHTLIMSTILNLLQNKIQKLTKGDQIWDYIYSKDAAYAFRLVAEKGKDGSIYCFGTGKTKRLSEFVSILKDTIDPSINLKFGTMDYYPNQVMHLEADIQNLVEDTGFEACYSFEEGIAETIAWVKDNRI